jgi:hypothetical protein
MPPPPSPPAPWPQNTIQPPVPAQNAVVNPRLAQIKRAPLIYTMSFEYDPSSIDQTFTQTFQVDLSNDWFFANAGATAFVIGTDAPAYPVGFLTLRSSSDQYPPIMGLPLQSLSRSASPASPNPANYRTILPEPWGIGAAGAFTATIFAPGGIGSVALDCQVTFEGWRWFDFDTVDMIDDATIW